MSSVSSAEFKSKLPQLSETNSVLLADIYEDYAQRCENGERPDVNEYARRYPEIASVILDVFQALGGFEQVQATACGADAETVPPKHVAGCEVIRRIGSGGMGVVYETKHPSLSRRLAVKVLSGRGRFSPSHQERFLREAEAASRLSHPHIVPLIDFGHGNSGAYISMPYVDGMSLDHVLKSMISSECNDVDPEEEVALKQAIRLHVQDLRNLAALGADVASALAHAHENRIIHRDIKPGNLIVDRKFKVWVTDFGLAKMCSEQSQISQTGEFVGTPRYMAPEQAGGRCATQSDVYSLGVTLYELAGGRKAWDAIPSGQVIAAKSQAELPDLSDIAPHVPAELSRIIMKACAFHPDDRYDTALELQHVLMRFAEGHRSADRRRRQRVEGDSYVRRKPVFIASACVAGAIALAYGLSALTTQAEPETNEFLQHLTSEEFLEQVVEELPDVLEGDTSEKQERRAEIAELAQHAISDTLDSQTMDETRRAQLRENFGKLNEAYRSGEISKDKYRATFEKVKASNIPFVLRFQSFRSEIIRSSLSDSAKSMAFELLKELSPAAGRGWIDRRTVQWLNAKLPKKGEQLASVGRDAVVRDFLNSSLAALNAIPGMPAGPPGSRERLDYLLSPTADPALVPGLDQLDILKPTE